MSWTVLLNADFWWLLITPPLFTGAFASELARLIHPRRRGACAYKAHKEHDLALCVSALFMLLLLAVIAFFDKPSAGIFALPYLPLRLISLRKLPGAGNMVSAPEAEIERISEKEKEEEARKQASLIACAVFTGLSVSLAAFKVVIEALG